MKRKLVKKVFSGFMVLSIILGEVGAVGPAFAQSETTALANNTKTSNSVRTKNIAKESKKSELSSAEKKMDADLLKLLDDGYLLKGENRADLVARMKIDKQFVDKTDSTRTNLRKKSANRDDLVYVYIRLKDTASINAVDSAVWEVTGREETQHLLVAFVEVSKIKALAALPDVLSIKIVAPPKVRKGSVTTEGDIVHQTAAVRTAYAEQGAGIKIGVISDGLDGMASAKASGDLPSNITVLSNTQGGAEGTAMLEIIYDMAPGASLYFHDNGTDMLSFNAAVDDLVAAGCKVIVDDLGYDEEAFFENGVIGSHMASIIATKDIVFVSACGNEADVHYQGTYYDDGTRHNDFSRGSSSSNKYLYVNLPAGEELDVVLQWNDKFGQSSNDYDLELHNKATQSKLAESTETQDGSGDPLETIYYTNNSYNDITVEINVANYAASTAKILELYVYFSDGEILPYNIVAADSIYGHPAIPGVIGVAAIDAEDPGHDTIEYYSSRGPVTIIGESSRAKPDITALDNVAVTGVGGFGSPFAGTSASAPAVAAVVAQLWGAFPTLKGNQVRDALYDSAVDLGTAGFDYSYGYGRVDALRAYQLLSANVTTKSSAKAITSFIIAGQAGIINEANHSVNVNLPAGTSVTSLAPTVTVSTGASISPASSVAKNFTNPIVYTVTAEDGSTQAYVATVNVSAANLSSAKAITAFTLGGKTGIINETNHSISVSLPVGTSVTSLAPNISISSKASISPASGASKNFTSPVVYTVTAENGSTQAYVVTAAVGTATLSSAKAITSFTLAGQAGVINESSHSVNVSLPAGTSVTSLAPTISISPKASLSPVSGSAKNFTNPIVYTVTAEDGSTQAYTATVTVSMSADTTAPVITMNGSPSIDIAVGGTYNEPGATATDNRDGSVNVTISGAVNTALAGDYTIIYVATDAAGNIATAARIIRVGSTEESISSEDSITSFKFAGLSPVVNGIIDETNHKILLTVPYGTNVTALVPTITLATGATIIPNTGVAQNFSISKTYTITSASGAKQAYTVTVKIDASSAETVTATNNDLTITAAQKGVLVQTLINSNKVQAEIPKGSVTSDTTFTIVQQALAATDIPNISGAKLFSGLAFNIEGVDKDKIYIESLEDDMTVTITVPNLLKNTASLKIYYYDEARKNWAPVTGVTFGANTITFIADYLATFAVFQVPVALPAGVVDGDIVQCKSSTNPNAVYIVKIVGKNAYIRHIVSLQIFNYYKHLKWENLKQVGSLEPFSLSGWVRVNTGTNGQSRSGDKVWEINGDQTRHWINMTAQQFLTHGGSDEAIYTVNQGELNLYAQGPDVMSL